MKLKIFILLLVLVVSLLCSCQPKHTHSFSDTYSGDDVYHWYECECGEKDGYEQHAWNNGSVTLQPSVDSEGERTFTCTVCRATKVEKIEKLSPDHVHEYNIPNKNENFHWNECVCGEKSGALNHVWDNGTIVPDPMNADYDVKIYVCKDCGASKTEELGESVKWIDDEKINLDYAYSFAIVGDTQVLCQKYPDKMVAIYDLILENKDQRKITQVIGLGDITEGIWDVSNTPEE